jgi:hypothetical protein
MADVDWANQARQEVKDMIDATLSIVIREYDVDQAFAINEIKPYLKKLENSPAKANWFRKIKYTSKSIFSSQPIK